MNRSKRMGATADSRPWYQRAYDDVYNGVNTLYKDVTQDFSSLNNVTATGGAAPQIGAKVGAEVQALPQQIYTGVQSAGNYIGSTFKEIGIYALVGGAIVLLLLHEERK